MSRPLHFALLVSAAVHGLAAAAWYVPREPEAPAALAATLRLAPIPSASADSASTVHPDQRVDPSRTRTRVAHTTAVASVAGPAAFTPAAAPAEEKASTPAVPSGQASAPAAAPVAPAPLESPRFAAAYLANPPPSYPVSARRRGIEGEVRVEARISPSGQAQEVKLAASAGDAALDQAALEAVRHWRFEPARQGSQAVEAWVSIPVVFRLN